MNKLLSSSRVRSNEEIGPWHAKISAFFLQQTLAPDAQLTMPISRIATDGTFDRKDHHPHLVR
jgi:hypothetical protein